MNTQVSVIIPVYNSRRGLKSTVEALLRQKGIERSMFEIIIVDNNSADGTMELAKQYALGNPALVKVCEEKIQSSYAARNKGIARSRGDLLVFMDADMIPEERYLSKILASFRTSEIAYAGTRVELLKKEEGLVSDYNALMAFDIKSGMERGHFAPTCCLTIRKEVVREIGPFDQRLESGGDVEFGKRAYDAGFDQHYLGHIRIQHPTRATFSALKKKACRIARGYAQLLYYYPDRFAYKKEVFRKLKRYMPNNPFILHELAKKRNFNFGIPYCMVLSLLNTPLKFYEFKSYKKETKKLFE